jgi:nucleotide-binding universal stress UspA family protein
MYVNDPMLVAAAAVAFGDRDYAKVALAELRPFVTKALGPATRRAIRIHYATDKGEPTRMIAGAAKRIGCDLIVMGTHGLSGVDKVILGSTTEFLMRHSALPVLAVPPSPSVAISGQTPGRRWPGTAMMVPVDLGTHSAEDVRDAEEIAHAFGARLVLIHVVDRIEPPPWYRSDLSAHWRLEVTKAQRQLEILAAAVRSDVATEVRVAAGPTAEEISAVAAEERIGLVVMHRRRGPSWFGPRAGSIATRVLRDAVTPVLVLPDRAVKRRQLTRERLRASA